MATNSPILAQHQQAEAATLTYGTGADGTPVVEVVGTFGDLELEYAAIRKSCVLIDLPQRGVLEVTGPERLEFLNRMLTQELKNLPPFASRRSFWLNRKGRIDADVRVIDLPSRTLLDVDVLATKRALDGLASYIITEDVQIRDVTQEMHRLSLHGPTSIALVSGLALHASGADASGPAFGELLDGRACVVRIAGHEVVVDRDDSAGEVGLELTMGVNAAAPVYEELLRGGLDPEADVPPPQREASRATTAQPLGSRVRLRPAGWLAYNIARIEAGSPMYNIDFGADSLPAESGVINDRVSFTKGCYLGQEIVARMHARGHPKQCLVALRLADDVPLVRSKENPDVSLPLHPLAGAHVFAARQGDEAPPAIGIVTSSTLSPMLGAKPVCFAQVKWEYVAAGTKVAVEAEGSIIDATVQPSLAFWRRG